MSVTPVTVLPVTIVDADPDVEDSGDLIDGDHLTPNFAALRDGLNNHSHTEITVDDDGQQVTVGNIPDGYTLAIKPTEDGAAEFVFTADGNIEIHIGGTVLSLNPGLFLLDTGLGARILLEEDGIGFFGHAAVSQPAAPETLDDVIAVLKTLGLVQS